MRDRRRQYAKLIEEKKIPQSKDRTHVIYVAVPKKQDPQSVVMEEFEFQINSEGTHYEFSFGHIKLRVFDWRKYSKMMRRIKQ